MAAACTGPAAPLPTVAEQPIDGPAFAANEGWGLLSAEAVRKTLQHSPLAPPPPDSTNAWFDSEDAAALGQYLFFDQRMSKNGKVSCATCHDPKKSFADGRTLAVGMEIGSRHTPSLWNVAYNRWFFWDGRADTLWTQALSPLESSAEHGSNRREIADLIRSDPMLAKAYEQLFGKLTGTENEHSFDRALTNVGKAIAAYERRLLSRSARFDRFVLGIRENNPEAMGELSLSEQRGLALFVGKANCRLCHAGPLFSDREFHDTRVPLLNGDRAADSGRYGGIEALRASEFRGAGKFGDGARGDSSQQLPEPVQRGENWGEFKTPTLRNVALTAPYMHQGQLKSLRDVVHFYSTLENARPPHGHGETTMVPLELTESEIGDLVDFLGALTDDSIDADLLRAPPSPFATSDRKQR